MGFQHSPETRKIATENAILSRRIKAQCRAIKRQVMAATTVDGLQSIIVQHHRNGAGAALVAALAVKLAETRAMELFLVELDIPQVETMPIVDSYPQNHCKRLVHAAWANAESEYVRNEVEAMAKQIDNWRKRVARERRNLLRVFF